MSTTETNRSFFATDACLLVALACVLLCACSPARDTVGEISVDALSARLSASVNGSAAVFLLDVRTREEFSNGHIPGAANIPHTELEKRLNELSADDEVLVYCEKGARARAAIGVLSRAGFANILQVEGDMAAWRASGLPISRPLKHQRLVE